MEFQYIKTMSICPYCYKKIPALITVGDGVHLEKHCLCGFSNKVLIENDSQFYNYMRSRPYYNTLGNVVNISITDTCNTTCRACYHKRGANPRPVGEIIGLAYSSPTFINKYVLTGGEPTTHPDLFDITAQLETGIITNGIAFADKAFLSEYLKFRVYGQREKELFMMLSLNLPSSPDYDSKLAALENIRSAGLKVGIIVSTVETEDEIDIATQEFEKLKDVAYAFKIRSAFNIGESGGNKFIALSDMVKSAKKSCKSVFEPIEGLNNNCYLVNTQHDDKHLILVNCPNVDTIDLNNIGPTGPYQYSKLDTFEDVMVSLIVDEGIEKGWFNGRRLV